MVIFTNINDFYPTSSVIKFLKVSSFLGISRQAVSSPSHYHPTTIRLMVTPGKGFTLPVRPTAQNTYVFCLPPSRLLYTSPSSYSSKGLDDKPYNFTLFLFCLVNSQNPSKLGLFYNSIVTDWLRDAFIWKQIPNNNKTKVISADLLDFSLYSDGFLWHF